MRINDREDYPDAVWHVSSRVNWRVWHLDSDQAYRIFLSSLRRAIDRYGVDLVAFVLMSNHYHAVLRSPPPDQYRALTGRMTRCRHFRPYRPGHPNSNVIGQFLRHFKLAVAKQMQHVLGLEGHFWDGKHFRRTVRDASDLVIVVAYDHRNPVREAMATLPEEYERSSAAWWQSGAPAPIELCRRTDFPFDIDREAFREALLEWQADNRADDVMEAFFKKGLRLDSSDGWEELRRMLRAAGLEPPF